MTVSKLAASLYSGIAPRSHVSSGSVVPTTSALQRRSRLARRGFTSSARRPSADIAGLKDVLRISEEVADAVAANKPVVALESTIYTHGAFDEDLGLEDIVRKLGAIPAVCGVYNGVATVGLEKHQIQEMVDGKASKVSRRDLAVIVGDGLRGMKRHGGTTIAGTMILARLAGIRVFGTGGLGGVHRGGESTMDISADLTELGRTRVAVVSAGCKGFLDIPRTLEYLETQGVVVSTLNSTGQPDAEVNFPAFWARDSGVKSPSHFRDAQEAACRIYAQEKLGIESGLLLANPIPEEAAIPREVMEDAINRAVREADEQGFTGSNNTPFILQRIRAHTEGRSVGANLALVRSNVAMAARVSRSLSDMMKGGDGKSMTRSPFRSSARRPDQARRYSTVSQVRAMPAVEQEVNPDPQSDQETSSQVRLETEVDRRFDVVVAGGVAIDLSCDFTMEGSPKMYTSNRAAISQSVGGVGHNVALAAHRFGALGGVKVKLCSVIGDDVAGRTVLEGMRASGLHTSGIHTVTAEEGWATTPRTAQYVAVNDSNKSLFVAMADMRITEGYDWPRNHWPRLFDEAQPRCVVVDANPAPSAILSVLSAAGRAKKIFEPVSVFKSARLFEMPQTLGVYPNNLVDLASPNMLELASMYHKARQRGYFHVPEWEEVIERFNMRGGDVDHKSYFEDMFASASPQVRAAEIPQHVLHLLPYIPSLVVKLGDQGCVLAEIMAPGDERLASPDEQAWILTRAAPGESSGRVGGVYMRHYPAAERVPKRDVVSVNGVGDTFLGVLTAGLARGVPVNDMIEVAQRAAVMTLRSAEAVSPYLRHVLLTHRETRLVRGFREKSPVPTGPIDGGEIPEWAMLRDHKMVDEPLDSVSSKGAADLKDDDHETADVPPPWESMLGKPSPCATDTVTELNQLKAQLASERRRTEKLDEKLASERHRNEKLDEKLDKLDKLVGILSVLNTPKPEQAVSNSRTQGTEEKPLPLVGTETSKSRPEPAPAASAPTDDKPATAPTETKDDEPDTTSASNTVPPQPSEPAAPPPSRGTVAIQIATAAKSAAAEPVAPTWRRAPPLPPRAAPFTSVFRRTVAEMKLSGEHLAEATKAFEERGYKAFLMWRKNYFDKKRQEAKEARAAEAQKAAKKKAEMQAAEEARAAARVRARLEEEASRKAQPLDKDEFGSLARRVMLEEFSALNKR